jgi:hypothetical protein
MSTVMTRGQIRDAIYKCVRLACHDNLADWIAVEVNPDGHISYIRWCGGGCQPAPDCVFVWSCRTLDMSDALDEWRPDTDDVPDDVDDVDEWREAEAMVGLAGSCIEDIDEGCGHRSWEEIIRDLAEIGVAIVDETADERQFAKKDAAN